MTRRREVWSGAARGLNSRYGKIGLVIVCSGAVWVLGVSAGGQLLSTLATASIFALVVTSLNVIIGYAGQFSLGQIGFMILGAYASAVLTTKSDLPAWCALACGVVISAAVAVLLGLICFRMHGFYFSIATLGFGLIAVSVVQGFGGITGGSGGLVGVPPIDLGPVSLASPRSIFYAAALLTGLSGLYIANVLKTRIGLAMRSTAVDEAMTAAAGVSPLRIKLYAFIFSAVLASIAGSLYASFLSVVSPDSFDITVTIQLLVMLFLGGSGALWGPGIGSSLLVIQLLYQGTGAASGIIDGAILAGVLLVVPGGVASVFGALRRRMRASEPPLISSREQSHLAFSEIGENGYRSPNRFPTGRPEADQASESSRIAGAIQGDAEDARPVPAVSEMDAVLRIVDLNHSYGGLQAVAGVGFEVAKGELLAIIGPNGAGKTTLVNLISGGVTVRSGHVFIAGRDIAGLSAHRCALAGVARTFQIPRMWEAGSALDNVLMGSFAHRRGGFLSSFVTPWRVADEQAGSRRDAQRLLELVGLGEKSERRVAELTAGEIRLVDMARAMSQRPRVLLLDEPAAGLIDAERARLAEVIQGIAASGVAVCLIEHNMDLVFEVAQRIIVMNYGQIIADGIPSEVIDQAEVQEAYLGVGTRA